MNALAFELEPDLEAHEPPEERGVARDGVRMLVARRSDGSVEHRTFSDLPELLEPGDVLVINVSATIPAAVPARRRGGEHVRVHFATRAPHLEDDWRVVEIRGADGSRPQRLLAGESLALRGGATLELVAPYASGERLMLARFCCTLLVDDYLDRHGEPIRYSHVPTAWPLEAYQNVYAISPAAPRCRAPAGRSLASSSRAWSRRASSWRRSRCIPACPRPRPRAPVPRVVRGPRAHRAADRDTRRRVAG